jgi:tripartite ATP-independent transporter DctM subunit
MTSPPACQPPARGAEFRRGENRVSDEPKPIANGQGAPAPGAPPEGDGSARRSADQLAEATVGAVFEEPHEAGGRETAPERWAVVAIGLIMVLLPTLGAFVRKFSGQSLNFTMIYTQHLTLWIGFLGALLAAARGQHLALSTLEMLPEGRLRELARTFGHAVSAFTCAMLAYASTVTILADRTSQETLQGGVPAFLFEAVMPIVFALMAARFAQRTPTLAGRIVSWLLVLVMVPFSLSAVSSAYGHAAFLPPFDGSTILGGHGTILGWIGSGLLLFAFLLGTPVFVVMAGLALLLFFVAGTPVAAVPTETFRLVQNPTLPAIPLLTIAGYVLAEGGASRRLVRAAQAIFGWMPGGLAVVAVVVCALFTTFTGASGVTILALGGLIFPALVREGYPEGFALGLVTASGSLGLLFPPSLPVILYAVVAQVPIERLYYAGLGPGLFMIVLVALYGVRAGIVNKTPRQPFVAREALIAMWGAKWDLGLPTLIIVAVVSGFATIVEASALGAAYSILAELLIFRDIHPVRDLPRVLAHAATLVGSVIILLGVAMGLTNYFVDAEIPTQLLAWVQAHLHSQWEFLLALNVILLVLGSVLEIYSAIVVLAPLIAPLGKAFGVDPVHLGVVFLANLELGFLFPPMGLNLFLAASRFKKPLPLLYRKAFPFLVIMSVGVLLITYSPMLVEGIAGLFRSPGAAGAVAP